MTRIRSTNIKYGDSFVLPIEKAKEEKTDSPELIQLKEELRLLNLEVAKAKERKENILNEAKAEAEKLIQDTNNKIQQENILSEDLIKSLGGGADLVLESKKKSKEEKKREKLKEEKKKQKEERKGKRAMKREEIAVFHFDLY